MKDEADYREGRMVRIQRWIAFAALVVFSIFPSIIAKYFDYGSCNFSVSFGFFSGVSNVLWYAVTSMILVALSALLVFGNVHGNIRLGVYILLAGGISNLIVRVMYGCVWDWINLWRLGISFNMADILIDIGMVVSLLGLLSNLRDNGE